MPEAGRDDGGAVLVSACLIGVCCRYDGQSRSEPRVVADLAGTRMVPICPEQMGGLPTPRVPCDIVGGDGAAVLSALVLASIREGSSGKSFKQRTMLDSLKR